LKLKRRKFVLIIGPSGIGKGYGVGSVLIEYFGLVVFVSGDWCRAYCKAHADTGALADDDLIIDAITEAFESEGKPMCFAVDAPRSLAQAQKLIALFKKWDADCEIHTIHITALKKIAVERLVHRAGIHGREDDKKKKVISVRLKHYYGRNGIRTVVAPFLKRSTTYHPVDGSLDLEIIREFVRFKTGPAIFGQESGMMPATAGHCSD